MYSCGQEEPHSSDSLTMPCKCKAGAWRKPGCESLCKRCGCDCNGIAPAVALARTIGRQEGSIIRKRVSAQEEPVAVAVKRQRVAAQIAQEKIEVIAHEHTVYKCSTTSNHQRGRTILNKRLLNMSQVNLNLRTVKKLLEDWWLKKDKKGKKRRFKLKRADWSK